MDLKKSLQVIWPIVFCTDISKDWDNPITYKIFLYIKAVSINAQWPNPDLWRHSQSQLQLNLLEHLVKVWYWWGCSKSYADVLAEIIRQFFLRLSFHKESLFRSRLPLNFYSQFILFMGLYNKILLLLASATLTSALRIDNHCCVSVSNNMLNNVPFLI